MLHPAKKRFSVVLALLLLVCMFGTAAADNAPWPVKTYYGVGVGVSYPPNNQNVKRQAYYGPNPYTYAGAGAFKARSVQNAVALFREGDFALVDFYYPSMGKYCVYFQIQDLTTRNIDQETLTAYPAAVTAEIQPMMGPGYDYRPMEELTPSRNVRQVLLTRGMRVNVLFEMNGWVFAEFSCAIGTVRAWLPANMVESI